MWWISAVCSLGIEQYVLVLSLTYEWTQMERKAQSVWVICCCLTHTVCIQFRQLVPVGRTVLAMTWCSLMLLLFKYIRCKKCVMPQKDNDNWKWFMTPYISRKVGTYYFYAHKMYLLFRNRIVRRSMCVVKWPSVIAPGFAINLGVDWNLTHNLCEATATAMIENFKQAQNKHHCSSQTNVSKWSKIWDKVYSGNTVYF